MGPRCLVTGLLAHSSGQNIAQTQLTPSNFSHHQPQHHHNLKSPCQALNMSVQTSSKCPPSSQFITAFLIPSTASSLAAGTFVRAPSLTCHPNIDNFSLPQALSLHRAAAGRQNWVIGARPTAGGGGVSVTSPPLPHAPVAWSRRRTRFYLSDGKHFHHITSFTSHLHTK